MGSGGKKKGGGGGVEQSVAAWHFEKAFAADTGERIQGKLHYTDDWIVS